MQVSHVMKKKRGRSYRRSSDHLFWILEGFGEDTHTPCVTHTLPQKGEEADTIHLDLRSWNNTGRESVLS